MDHHKNEFGAISRLLSSASSCSSLGTLPVFPDIQKMKWVRDKQRDKGTKDCNIPDERNDKEEGTSSRFQFESKLTSTDSEGVQWICDVCRIAVFENLEEAKIHEYRCRRNAHHGESFNPKEELLCQSIPECSIKKITLPSALMLIGNSRGEQRPEKQQIDILYPIGAPLGELGKACNKLLPRMSSLPSEFCKITLQKDGTRHQDLGAHSSQKDHLTHFRTQSLLQETILSKQMDTQYRDRTRSFISSLTFDIQNDILGQEIQNREKKEINWLCDTCKVATFNSYVEAYIHEKLCQGSKVERVSIDP
jgi:hypothetical protein